MTTMKPPNDTPDSHIADVIESRSHRPAPMILSFTPAIDVYDDGQLLAGYAYNTIDECVGNLTKVLQIHLQSGPDQG